MQIDLTLRGPRGSCDVTVRASAPVPYSSVAGEFAQLVGADGGTPVSSGGVVLPSTRLLGGPGLRDGCVLDYAATPIGGYAGPLTLQFVGGPHAGSTHHLSPGSVTVGRADDCTIVVTDDRASRRHALLEIGRSTLVLHDLASTNGTTVDGEPVDSDGVAMSPGQVARIGDSFVAIAGATDTPATLSPTSGADGVVLVNRSPRAGRPPMSAAVLDVPGGRTSQRPHRVQWITAMLPAVAGVAIAVVTDSPQFLLFALLSPLMMVSGSLGDRLHWRRDRRREAAQHRRDHAALGQSVVLGLRAETMRRRLAAPGPPVVRDAAVVPTVRLWERRRNDPDALHSRTGTADLPSELMLRSGTELAPAGRVPAVPVLIDLRAGPLGIAGPPDVTAGVARWVVAQLATLHSTADLQIVFVLTHVQARRWAWARWLPHARGPSAAAAAEWSVAIAELSRLADTRRAGRSGAGAWPGPWTLLVVDDAEQLAELPGLDRLLAVGSHVGITALCVAAETSALPTACSSLVRAVDPSGNRIEVCTGLATIEAVADQVTTDWADGVARALAPLVDAAGQAHAAIPGACSLAGLLDLDLDPAAITERWTRCDGGAATVLGAGSDGPITLDLVADGPHALVAGTTGSGKSELLRTLVAGLAVNHPPDRLAFLLVDYKGGAAFAECAHLPHTAGVVTDLDRQLTGRALRSLDAELRRRERIFAVVGAADLDAHRAASADDVSRLVIVVDEFAALAEDLPDFVDGLIGIAQRGRSLGVHLVLATQRPGSVVSADIRANTSARIALRVTDPADSLEVIDSPDAAAIAAATPGRGYLRRGGSLAAFQCAIARGTESTSTAPEVEVLDAWRKRRQRPSDDTGQLADLVSCITAAAVSSGRPGARRPWLAPLAAEVALESLAACGTPTAVPIGLVDLPDDQTQPPLLLDVGGGHSMLIAGTHGTGRTTALATAVVSVADHHSPAEQEIHVIDGAGELARLLAGLPHLGTVLGPRSTDLTTTLLRRLLEDVTAPRPGPPVLLVVDAWPSVLRGQDDVDAARCTDLLTDLLRATPHRPLTVLVAGDRTSLLPRFAGNFGARIVLALTDAADYALAGVNARDVPAAMPPGRGLRAGDGAAIQFAHAGSDPGHEATRRHVAAIAHRYAGAPVRATTLRLRSLPQSVTLTSIGAASGGLRIGVAGDAAETCTIDLLAHRSRLLVAGPPRAGKSTLLAALLLEACRAGLDAVVAAAAPSPLAALAGERGVRLVGPGDDTSLGAVPTRPTILLIDDSAAFADTQVEEQLQVWARNRSAPLAVALAGRCDDLITAYRGLAADIRREHCGVLLRPGPVDGELFGVRIARRPGNAPPGRGWAIGDPAWGPLFESGEPVPIQVAHP